MAGIPRVVGRATYPGIPTLPYPGCTMPSIPSRGPQGAVCAPLLLLPWSSGCCMCHIASPPMVLRVLYVHHSMLLPWSSGCCMCTTVSPHGPQGAVCAPLSVPLSWSSGWHIHHCCSTMVLRVSRFTVIPALPQDHRGIYGVLRGLYTLGYPENSVKQW